ncbi:hypothetical protein BGZ73_006095 [Actinomortierella ambigua]|nr:hypothetical protein BGZ73_006095 [Actinomortierella ambigua]
MKEQETSFGQASFEHSFQQHNDASDNTDSPEHRSLEPDFDFSDDRTAFERLAYAVSLNYNKPMHACLAKRENYKQEDSRRYCPYKKLDLATSIFYPVTGWHWYDPIRNTMCILGAVPSRNHLAHLSTTYNVRYVINMCAEFPGHLETMKELGIKQCWLPTKDFHTPSTDSLWRGVKYIEDVTAAAAVAASRADIPTENGAEEPSPSSSWSFTSAKDDSSQPKGKIYLHCKAGRGRSASVAICWLVYEYDLTLAQAQKILLLCRGQPFMIKYKH